MVEGKHRGVSYHCQLCFAPAKFSCVGVSTDFGSIKVWQSTANQERVDGVENECERERLCQLTVKHRKEEISNEKDVDNCYSEGIWGFRIRASEGLSLKNKKWW